MNRDNLPQTRAFEMRIVTSVKALEVDCYGVYHKYTDVLNHKDTSITRCYDALHKMQGAYDEMLQKERAAEIADGLRAKSNIVKLT